MHQLKDLMSPDVKIIGPDVSIREAASQMRDGDFGMMPVGDSKVGLIGTISDRDIAIRAVAQGLSGDTRVRDVMSKGVSSVLDTDSVDDAVRVMSERQVRRLPVLDVNRNLVGIVALGDLAVKDAEKKPAAQALSQISKPS